MEVNHGLNSCQINGSGKLHLVKSNQLSLTRTALCGRRLHRSNSLQPASLFDFEENCCNCCIYKHRLRKERSSVLAEAKAA